MKQYIQAVFPADFKHNQAYWRAFILGIIMLILALTQLFKFEEFPALIEMMRAPGGGWVAWLLAGLLPLLEIASLPYLLSMRNSSRARRISMCCGFVVGTIWLLLTCWTSAVMGMSVESGVFGGTIATNSGWWSVLFALLLLWSHWLTTRELPKRRGV